jgi:hypothetical protein
VELQDLEQNGFGKVYIGKKRTISFLKPHPTSLEENHPVLKLASISLDRYTANFLKVCNMDEVSKQLCLNKHQHREMLIDILTQFSDESDDSLEEPPFSFEQNNSKHNNSSKESVSLSHKNNWYQKSTSVDTTPTTVGQSHETQTINESVVHNEGTDTFTLTNQNSASELTTVSIAKPTQSIYPECDYIPPNVESQTQKSNLTLNCSDDPSSYYKLSHTGMPNSTSQTNTVDNICNVSFDKVTNFSQITPVKVITLENALISSQISPVNVVVKTIKLCKSQPKSDWKVKLTPKTHIQ